jgi:trehalose 6-phosphate phosphatase
MYLRAVDSSSLPTWPGRTALFLDLDGTLLEFADKPHLVELSARFRGLLPRLLKLEDGGVAIVSGRSIADLDGLLAPYRFAVAGVHGSERRNYQGEQLPSKADPEALAPVRTAIERFVAEHDDLVIEDKRISIALHYRLRPDLSGAIETCIEGFSQALPAEYVLLRGKMMFEVHPAGVDKGSAIRDFMNEAPFAGATPVFIGDDVTDEAGFKVVNDLGGMSVKVNSGDTAAAWRLDDVDAVLDWLDTVVPE